ncbi:MAG: hypothetical protein JRI97_11240, partial [Deltaproteobacteria bacterium]|nr:hypothetical protein [Deltaproteobacteria bacterium]
MIRPMALFAVLLLAAPAAAADAPGEVAGVRLGREVGELSGRLLMDTVLPVRYAETMKEVELAPTPGFKSGLVYFGTCAIGRKVARIEL